MGNDDNGCFDLFLKIAHQIQDLCLDRYIKGCGRLICDQHLGITCQCNGDDNSLSHTTGQLVWILVVTCLRIGDSNQGKKLNGSCLTVGFTHLLAVLFQHFLDLFSNLHSWIQGSHRILEDHGNLASAHLLHLTF